MSVQKDLYEQYITGLTTHVNNVFGVIVTRNANKEDRFPIIEIKPLLKIYESETLNYTERKDRFGYEVNIYAQDLTYQGTRHYGDDLVLELSDLVDEYFSSQGFKVTFNDKVRNIDVEVERRVVRVEGIYDYERSIMFKN